MAVTDQVKQSDDPSQYTVLVDDNYVQSDGTPPLQSQTAEIPDGDEGDSDLAEIALDQLPSSMTDGSVQIVLSDPSAVRLFESDGTLFYDEDSTGDAPLTLDVSSPSGYLAGLQSGEVDLWVEAVHPDSDFSFTVLYDDDQGDVARKRLGAHDDRGLDVPGLRRRVTLSHRSDLGAAIPVHARTDGRVGNPGRHQRGTGVLGVQEPNRGAVGRHVGPDGCGFDGRFVRFLYR